MHPKSYAQLPDADLVARLQADTDPRGAEAALSALYDRYSGQLDQVARRFRLDTSAAADVVTGCFYELWLQRARLGPTTALPALLTTIAKRRLIDALRQQAVRAQAEGRYADRQSVHANSTAHALEEAELGNRLAEGIERLPQAMRAVYERSQQGQSVQAIAGALGLSPKTVEEQLRRAHQRLRAYLK
ncbi:MAG: sigma-70 family RNA polymerase sigma factor [Bacteroidia bacterium]|nr:sigma-70 family RNA polymerase sigma factor [Bacteroidia bacterium]